MDTENTVKCAHPSCTCQPWSGSKYCSAQCAAMGKIPDVDCRCTHSECKGKAH